MSTDSIVASTVDDFSRLRRCLEVGGSSWLSIAAGSCPSTGSCK